MLSYDDMFGPIEGNINGLEFELTEVLGPEANNVSPDKTIASSNSSDNEITDEDEPMTLGSQIIFQWEQRKGKVEHNYSIYGWALSVMPAVRDDVVNKMTGVNHDAIECVVTKLHETPYPNKSIFRG